MACVASVDESVGEILDYLKRTGLDKNTIVVYTTDQGFYLNPEKPDVPLNKNDAFQKVQKRRVQEKR